MKLVLALLQPITVSVLPVNLIVPNLIFPSLAVLVCDDCPKIP